MGASLEHRHLRVTESNSPDLVLGDMLDVALVREIRHLASRRKVWQGTCRGRDVLVKEFFPHRKQLRDVGREWNSSILFEENNVLVPSPLVKASSESGDIVVIYEFIDDARTLYEVIVEAELELVRECFRQLVRVHARQYALGAYQSDNHLANYMWANGRLYVIDTGSVLVEKAPLSESKRLMNMAQLLAYTPFDRRILLFKLVCESAVFTPGIHDAAGFTRQLEARVSKAVRKRLGKYVRKTRRSSEEFIHQCEHGIEWRAWHGVDPALRDDFIQQPQVLTQAGSDPSYKIVQFPKVGGLKSRLGFRKLQPALVAWSTGHALLNFRIACGRPLICITDRVGAPHDCLMVERIEGQKLSSVSAEALLNADAAVPCQLIALLMQIADIGAGLAGVKRDDFVLDNQGRLRIADTQGIVLGAGPESLDLVHFASSELLPEGLDPLTYQACIDAMLAEVGRIESGQLAT